MRGSATGCTRAASTIFRPAVGYNPAPGKPSRRDGRTAIDRTATFRGTRVSEQDDQIFLKRFSLVMVGLILFAIVIIFMAIALDDRVADSGNPAQEVAKVERIKPVFDVYAGDDGRAAAEAARSEPAPAGAAVAAGSARADAPAADAAGGGTEQVSAAGDIDGQQIYQNACRACHIAGAAGAPQLVAEQWTERLDKGVETLVDHAINGFNAMPAKGGRADLTDEQVRASVEYMISQVR